MTRKTSLYCRLSYSPADSLDSSVTLVSGFANITPGREDDLAPGREFDQENDVDLPKVVNNSERGTREKRFPDGRLEIWYANGNRYIFQIFENEEHGYNSHIFNFKM